MAFNSSLSHNASLPSPTLTAFHFALNCINTETGTAILTSFTVTSFLAVVPLCVFVLYLGHRHLKQQGSCSKMRHSDFFTQHVVVMELVSVAGAAIICCGVYADVLLMRRLGLCLFSFNISGQIYFHILTCLEHYLAVVQPITYLNLSKTTGTRFRNATLTCVWLLSFGGVCLLVVAGQLAISIVSFCCVALFLLMISFCSLSALRVLTRPRPGDGDRQRVDASKMRAFYTIVAILGVLLVRFGGSMLSTVMFVSIQSVEGRVCDVWLSGLWFSLPSSLVLPLLFLQRAGKLQRCRK